MVGRLAADYLLSGNRAVPRIARGIVRLDHSTRTRRGSIARSNDLGHLRRPHAGISRICFRRQIGTVLPAVRVCILRVLDILATRARLRKNLRCSQPRQRYGQHHEEAFIPNAINHKDRLPQSAMLASLQKRLNSTGPSKCQALCLKRASH